MRRSSFVPSALSTLLVASAVYAGDPTLAETLFREGKALMDSKNYAQGCPKLDESYRQDPATGTLLAYAMCQEESGQLASAWTAYHSVIGRAEREGRPDRVDAARRRATALEARLSRLTVEVPAEVAALPGFAVTRDRIPLPAAAWGSATPTDSGDHVVEATADGRTPFRQTIAIAKEADTKVVRIPMLEPAPGGPPTATAPLPAKPSPASAAPTQPVEPRADAGTKEKSSSSLPLVGIVVGAAGIVTLGVGTAFGLRAQNLDEDSRNAGCSPSTGKCPNDNGLELNRDARDAGNLSTVLFAAGGALVAGGVVLYLVGSSQNDSSASLSVSPLVASGGGGVSLRARFE